MSSGRPNIPWPLLALDLFGTALIAVGALALTGVDFGYPVIREAAPVLIMIGAALMAPFILWVVRRRVRSKDL